MIGGAGSDALFGVSEDDIVIGGTTSYDNDPVALGAIIAEWGSSNSFATRVSNLSNGGGANGTFVLKNGVSATVFDDNATDQMSGGTGRDWFFVRKTGANHDSMLDFSSASDILTLI